MLISSKAAASAWSAFFQMYPVMRGYCVIQFLWDSRLWCFLCSSRIHMGMTCRRFQKFSTYVRRSVPATSLLSDVVGGCFWCVRRLVFLSANCGIFRVFFSENLRPYNNAVKKNGFTGFSCDFISIYEYSLWRRGRWCDIFICAGDQPLVNSIQ